MREREWEREQNETFKAQISGEEGEQDDEEGEEEIGQ